jgi:hypothetical protein
MLLLMSIFIHLDGVKSDNACIWWEDLLHQKQFLEVDWLAGYEGLNHVVKPFSKGMDKTGTVQADRASAEGTVVDFYSEIKIPKRIEVILLNPIPNVCSSILGKVNAH